MRRLVPLSLVSLFAICAATTAAFAGATVVIRAPEPSSLALLAGGLGAAYLMRKLRRRK